MWCIIYRTVTGPARSAAPLTAVSSTSSTLAPLNYDIGTGQCPIQSHCPLGHGVTVQFATILPKPVSPGAWVRPHNPVHLQRVCHSLEDPAGGATGPRIPHSPHRVAHHNGNDVPRLAGLLLAAAFPALLRVWGRVGLPLSLPRPSSGPPLPPL